MKSLARLFAVALLCVAQKAAATGLIFPIYGNTGAQFNAAVSAAGKVPTVAIINPDNGPGSRKVNGIKGNVDRLKGKGARVAGYINTFYGGADLGDVKADIDRYSKWYGANGIFLDEMADGNNRLNYYRQIYSYARGKGMTVVGNPGTFTTSGYYGVTSILITYEDPQSAGWNGHRQAGWTNGKPASRFGAVIYAAPGANMQSIVDAAVARNYGWVYVTDRGGRDPFGAAPSYSAALADAVKAKNGAK
jgi:hypothetical protein